MKINKHIHSRLETEIGRDGDEIICFTFSSSQFFTEARYETIYSHWI